MNGLEPFLPYSRLMLGPVHTAMNLPIAPFVFLLGFASLIARRLFPSGEWIENQLLWPSHEVPNKHIRLIL